MDLLGCRTLCMCEAGVVTAVVTMSYHHTTHLLLPLPHPPNHHFRLPPSTLFALVTRTNTRFTFYDTLLPLGGLTVSRYLYILGIVVRDGVAGLSSTQQMALYTPARALLPDIVPVPLFGIHWTKVIYFSDLMLIYVDDCSCFY